MVVSRSRTIAPDYGAVTLGSAELQDVKTVRILVVTSETPFREVVSKAGKKKGVGLGESCAERVSYLIVHVCSRVVSMHMFCSAWSIVSS